LQLTLMGANDDMDDATPQNLLKLEGLAHRMIEERSDVLGKVLGWFD